MEHGYSSAYSARTNLVARVVLPVLLLGCPALLLGAIVALKLFGMFQSIGAALVMVPH